jgi:hypothetical protein
MTRRTPARERAADKAADSAVAYDAVHDQADMSTEELTNTDVEAAADALLAAADEADSAAAKEAEAAAKEADAAVRARTGTLVGRVVASVANLLDLQLACVAGSVALGFGDDFFRAAQQELDRSACIGHARGTRIVPGGLGSQGPLVGAGAVAWRGLGLDVGVR